MPFPRMTTRRLIIAVVILAVWFAFVARARRLRGIGRAHMEQYASESRLALSLRDQRQDEAADAARASAARHLRTAQANNVEADFVESFTFALVLTAVCFGAALIVRQRRVRGGTTRAEPVTPGDAAPSGGP